jgi:hypothetical protein
LNRHSRQSWGILGCLGYANCTTKARPIIKIKNRGNSMKNIILNDGKTKETAIVINSGERKHLRFMYEFSDLIKRTNDYAKYELSDQVTYQDSWGFDRDYIYVTFYIKDENTQKYIEAEVIWLDITGPVSDHD